MKPLILSLLTLTAVSAQAGTYYECYFNERPTTGVVVDFDSEKDVTSFQVLKLEGTSIERKILAVNKMTNIDSDFKAIGESMTSRREATLEAGGKVQINKGGGQIFGFYKGVLLFGDQMEFFCFERND